jgi:hypothetical protein
MSMGRGSLPFAVFIMLMVIGPISSMVVTLSRNADTPAAAASKSKQQERVND